LKRHWGAAILTGHILATKRLGYPDGAP
jgi:hypothetical protein